MAINEYDELIEKGPEGAATGNSYDSIVQQQAKGQKSALQRSMFVAARKEPDRQAKVLELSKKTNMPASLVERNYDALQKKSEEALTDYDSLIEKTPGLAKWLENPDNAAIGKDDLDQLSRIDTASRRLVSKRPAEPWTIDNELLQAGQTGWQDLGSSALHLGAAYGLAPDDDSIYEAIASSNQRASELRSKQPAYATEWKRVMQLQGAEFDREFKRVTGSFDDFKRGDIKQALTEFSSGSAMTVWEAIEAVGAATSSRDRLKGLAYSGVENLSNSVPSLLAGFAGSKAGAAAGAAIGTAFAPGPGTTFGAGAGGLFGLAAGTFAGSVATEVGSWINQALTERGYNVTKADDIRRAYRDPELMADIRGEAERKGVTTAGVDALFSYFGGKFLKGAKPGLLGKTAGLATDVGVQAAGEAISEGAGQVAARKGDLGKVDFGEALLEGITSLGHSVGDVIVGSSVRKAFDKDPIRAAEQVAGSTRKAVQAQAGAQALAEVGAAVKESKTAKRDSVGTSAIAELVRVASEGNEAANVYFQTEDWDKHWAAQGLSPATAAEQVMGSSRAYHEAKSGGSLLAIPLDQYVSKVAPTEHFEALLPAARTQADGMTLAEAREHLAALPATMEELAREATGQPDTGDGASAAPIAEAIQKQLVDSGRYNESQASAMARASEAFFKTTAQRLGIDPAEFFKKFGPKIEGKSQPAVTTTKRIDSLDPLLDRLRSGAVPSDREAKGQTLVELLRERGGIRAEGEGTSLASLEPDTENKPFTRNLVKDTGMSADDAAKLAAELGYLPDADINGLLDAIGDELRGTPRYSPKNENAIAAEQLVVLQNLDEQLRTLGVDLAQADNATAKQALEQQRAAAPATADEIFLQMDRVHDLGVKYFQSEPFPLFQGEGTVTRGFYHPGERLIGLMKDANLATFFHESGHFYLDTMHKLVSEGLATPEMEGDYRTLLQFLEVESFDQVQTEHHEKAARAFEAYIMEGQAPSAALRELFYRFRTWLLSVYRSLKRLDVELTNEVRGVFDRLLATDDEIAAAQTEAGLSPLLEDPLAAGMSEAAAASYTKAVAEARQSAEEQLSAQVMGQMKREQAKAWKEDRALVQAEVEKEINAQPVFQALAALQRGTTPEGEALFGGRIALSREALVDVYGSEFVKVRLPKPYVYAREGGMHHDVAAEMYGFTSGDELVMALANAPKRAELIEAMTDLRMKEKHGDLMTDGTLPEAAMKVVHNEKRAQLLRKEMQILASENFAQFKKGVKTVTRPLHVPDQEVVRRQAEKTVSAMKVRDIQPALYQRAEAKAAREAVEAFLKGERELAFRAKERELLNHELYRAAVNAREEIDAGREFARRFSTRRVREMLGKAGQDYLEQADAIVDRFDFRLVALSAIDKRKSLIEFVEDQKKLGFNPVIPMRVMNEAYRQNFKELPLAEFQGVIDSLKNIETLARLKNKLLKAGKQRDFEAARDEAVSSIVAHSRGERKKDLEPRLPGIKTLRRLGAGFLASHRKFSSLIRQMDGYEDGGVLWELLTRPMNDAGNAEAVKKEQATLELKRLFGLYSKKDFISKVGMMYRKEFVPAINESITKMGRLMVALNWGNADNRQRVLNGRKWDDSQVHSILASLDARDWQFVQGIWDFLDSYWPEVQSLSQRTTGLSPSKVEAVPVETAFGTFRGGYFPLKYESRESPRASTHLAQEAAERALHGASVRSTTRHGHREARIEEVKRPVRLDFGVIFQHVNEVIHDLTHYEFLIDTNRILGDEQLQQTIFDHYGDQVYSELKGAIQDVAAGDIAAQQPFEQAMNYLRAGTSIAFMGWNLSTSLQQPLGLIPAARHVGIGYVLKGMGRWLGDAARMENTVGWIHERSDLMRLRAKTQSREIAEIQNTATTRGAVFGDIDRSYFYLISKAQMIADVPTWLGAYEKAMDSRMAPRDPEELESYAIAQADQAVLDTQGGGQTKDLASIQRGAPLQKLWTNFYSYFSVIYNRLAESTGRTDFKSPASIGVLAADVLFYISLPAAATTLLVSTLKGEDEDDLESKLLADQASYLMGMMVGVREISSTIQSFRGYEGPAGARFFAEFGNLYRQAEQGEPDEAFFRSLNKVGGIFFHYPAGQIDRTVRGIMSLQAGETSNPAAAIMGPSRR